MDRRVRISTMAAVHVLSHIKKLGDCSGQLLVRVICDCSACREIDSDGADAHSG